MRRRGADKCASEGADKCASKGADKCASKGAEGLKDCASEGADKCASQGADEGANKCASEGANKGASEGAEGVLKKCASEGAEGVCPRVSVGMAPQKGPTRRPRGCYTEAQNAPARVLLKLERGRKKECAGEGATKAPARTQEGGQQYGATEVPKTRQRGLSKIMHSK